MKEKKTIKERMKAFFGKGVKKVRFIKNIREAKRVKERELKTAELEHYMNIVQPMIRQIRGSVNDRIASFGGDPEMEVYLYDFISEAYQMGEITTGFDGFLPDNVMSVIPFESADSAGGFVEPRSVLLDEKLPLIAPKKVFKPIEVFDELGRVPTPITMQDLDEKVSIFRAKKDLIKTNRYAHKECIDMITRLENRRKWKEFEPFYSKYDCTTTDKINDLVNKYELVMKPADLFIPSFPSDAILIMKEYSEKTEELCGKKPVFYVIAEQQHFKKEEKRNDPILLVQSPFGIYWQILGAWDKEILILEEL